VPGMGLGFYAAEAIVERTAGVWAESPGDSTARPQRLVYQGHRTRMNGLADRRRSRDPRRGHVGFHFEWRDCIVLSATTVRKACDCSTSSRPTSSCSTCDGPIRTASTYCARSVGCQMWPVIMLTARQRKPITFRGARSGRRRLRHQAIYDPDAARAYSSHPAPHRITRPAAPSAAGGVWRSDHRPARSTGLGARRTRSSSHLPSTACCTSSLATRIADPPPCACANGVWGTSGTPRKRPQGSVHRAGKTGR